MIVLGVDPPNAVAVVDGDRLLHLDHWSKGLTEYRLCIQVQKAVDIAVRLGAEALAIEGQFAEWRDEVDKKKRAGINRSALILSGRAGFFRMEWLRVSMGRQIKVYAPSEWRAVSLGRGFGNSRDQYKEAARLMAKAIYGATVTTKEADEADAIGIARALSLTSGLEARYGR